MKVYREGVRCDLVLTFHRPSQSYSIRDHGGYESRNANTMFLLSQAMATVATRLPHSFTIPINTNDFVTGVPSFEHMAYSRAPEQVTTIPIPDFMFVGWPEVGMPDYETVVDQILEASARPPDDDRLFWIGNAETHPTRATLLGIAERSPRLAVVPTGWVPNSWHPHTRRLTPLNGYVSLPDHCRYRYLIDVQGRGWSARLKLLLFSGRTVFIQQRRWEEYFFPRLKPMVHFVPVREDLSDLEAQVAWADAHPDEALAIGRNGQQFAIGHLRRAHAIARMRTCLMDVSRRSGEAGGRSAGPVSPPPGTPGA